MILGWDKRRNMAQNAASTMRVAKSPTAHTVVHNPEVHIAPHPSGSSIVTHHFPTGPVVYHLNKGELDGHLREHLPHHMGEPVDGESEHPSDQ
jgi:hypothetical protein